MSLLKTINTKVITKDTENKIANAMIKQVLDGDIDAVQSYVKLTVLGNSIKQAKDAIHNETYFEMEKYGREDRTMYGCKFITGVRKPDLDYSQDGTWVELNKAVGDAAEALKMHEQFLKSLQSDDILDGRTGENYVRPKEKNNGRQTISIKVPKTAPVSA